MFDHRLGNNCVVWQIVRVKIYISAYDRVFATFIDKPLIKLPCIHRIHQVWSTGINVCAATSCTIQVLPSRRRRAVCRAVLTQTRNVEVHSELMHFLLNAKARPHRSRRHHHRLHRHRARQTSAQITTESIASQEPPWISVSRW